MDRENLYIYILQTVIDRIYKIGITEKKEQRFNFFSLNGHGGFVIKRLITLIKLESASNKKEKDAKLKHIIERLNNIHQINGQEIYSIKDDQELSELIDDIASGLKGEVISTDELKEFNEDYFDDYKLYKNDSNDNCCPQYKPQTVNHSIQKNRTNSWDVIGIRNGDILTFTLDSSISVVVSDTNNRKVKYLGKEYSLSRLAQQLLHKNSLQGPLYFKTKDGKTIADLLGTSSKH